MTLIFPFDQVQGENLNRLAGQYSIEEAIWIRLLGTRLEGMVDGDGQLSITISQYSGREEKEMPIHKKPIFTGVAAFLMPVFAASSANAQEHQDSGVAVLEEVIVTAQKREQNLQDVPISVSVITGERILNQNLVSLVDLSQQVPSLLIRQSPVSHVISLRGVSSGINSGFEQSVVTFVDGISHGRALQSRNTFLDIGQIEFLKGPQSTYFGNNAIAGALNVTTRKPGDEFEGSISALYEPDAEEYNVEAAFGGPITDTLGGRLAIRKWGMDGYFKNEFTGENGPQTDNLAGRATLVWTPNDKFDATVKVELGEIDEENAFPAQMTDCPSTDPLFAVPGESCAAALASGEDVILNDIFSHDPGQYNSILNREYVLTLNYENWDHTFTSITGYSSYDSILNVDVDGSGARRLVAGYSSEDFEQFSQELRLLSPAGGRFEYLAGLYYQEGDLDQKNGAGFFFLDPVIESVPIGAPLVPFLPIGREGSYNQEEESYAAFGSLTWNATDALRLTAGLRYTKVDKTLNNSTILVGTVHDNYARHITPLPAELDPLIGLLLGGATGTLPTQNRSDDDLLPSIIAQYDFNDAVMGYASYVEGFKAGGFDGQDVSGDAAQLPFEPETVKAYEIGMKSKLLDDRIFLNVALFRNEYSDLQQSNAQVDRNGFATFVIDNVEGMTSQGIEIDTGWFISDRLSIGLSLALLDAEYDSYEGAPCTPPQVEEFVPGPPPASQVCTQDLTGATPLLAPEISGNFDVKYTHPLSANLELASELMVYFTSDYNLRQDLNPLHEQDSYAKLDGRLTLRSTDGRWDLSLIGKNLTDEEIITYSVDLFLSNGSAIRTLERGRNIALQARYHW